MESVKKLLPYLLVAIVFAVGGYFIGQGGTSDQSAALYRGIGVINTETTKENFGNGVDLARYSLSSINCDSNGCPAVGDFVNGGTCYINGKKKGFWADGAHGVATGCYQYVASDNSQLDQDLLRDGGACLMTDGQGGAEVGIWNKKNRACYAQLITNPGPGIIK